RLTLGVALLGERRLVDFGTGQKQQSRLLLFPGRGAELELPFFALRQEFFLREIGAVEERRHAEIMVLRPIDDEWMVVAFGAVDADAEKQPAGVVRHVVDRSEERRV